MTANPQIASRLLEVLKQFTALEHDPTIRLAIAKKGKMMLFSRAKAAILHAAVDSQNNTYDRIAT